MDVPTGMGLTFSGVLTGVCNRTQEPSRQTTPGTTEAPIWRMHSRPHGGGATALLSFQYMMWVPVYPDTFPEDTH